MLKRIPALTAIWFLFCAANIGCPPTINFFSECILFCRIIGFRGGLVVPLFLLCFLAAGYSLFLYSRVNHGYQREVRIPFGGLRVRFLVCMVFRVIVLFRIFLFLDVVFL